MLRLAAGRRSTPPRRTALGLLLLGLLQLRLQCLDALLGRVQRLLLHIGQLGDPIARLGILLEQVGDQRVGLMIDGRGRDDGTDPEPPDDAPPTRSMKRVMTSRSSLVMAILVDAGRSAGGPARLRLQACLVTPGVGP